MERLLNQEKGAESTEESSNVTDGHLSWWTRIQRSVSRQPIYQLLSNENNENVAERKLNSSIESQDEGFGNELWPETRSNWFSRLTYSYLQPLLKLGLKRTLKIQV